MLKSLSREPLVHFLLLAAMVFAAHGFWSREQRQRIYVDAQTAAFLIEQRQDLELRSLSEEERRETIESFVEDEVLYREAYKRGLDRGDSRMRRNLILKMRGLLTADIPDPTEEDLRRHYDEHHERYTRPELWVMQQVFFNDPSTVPEGILEQLREGSDFRQFGDSTIYLGGPEARHSRTDIAGLFGPEVGRLVLELPLDQWRGPLESMRGVHFVRLVDRLAAEPYPFDKVREYVETDYLLDGTRGRIKTAVEEMKLGYEIVIVPLDSIQVAP